MRGCGWGEDEAELERQEQGEEGVAPLLSVSVRRGVAVRRSRGRWGWGAGGLVRTYAPAVARPVTAVSYARDEVLRRRTRQKQHDPAGEDVEGDRMDEPRIHVFLYRRDVSPADNVRAEPGVSKHDHKGMVVRGGDGSPVIGVPLHRVSEHLVSLPDVDEERFGAGRSVGVVLPRPGVSGRNDIASLWAPGARSAPVFSQKWPQHSQSPEGPPQPLIPLPPAHAQHGVIVLAPAFRGRPSAVRQVAQHERCIRVSVVPHVGGRALERGREEARQVGGQVGEEGVCDLRGEEVPE